MANDIMEKLRLALQGQGAPELELPTAPIEPEIAPEELQQAQADAETAQINEQAKSPNMMSKPELAEKQMQQEMEKTVPGQLQERAVASQVESPYNPTEKLRENITRYEELVNKPKDENNAMNWLTGIGKAANVLAKSKRQSFSDVDYWGDTQGAKKSAAKAEKLSQLQKLQGMYKDYLTTQKKDDMTPYQKAQLAGAKEDRALKERLAKLTAKSKARDEGTKRTKLQEEREKNIADRYDHLKEQVPTTLANVEEARFLIDELKGDRLNTGPGAQAAGYVGSFLDTEESTLKERLDSLAEKAARAQLKANGEVRPTDADVEGMKKAMFNLGNTEDANVEKLEMFIKQQEAGLNEYNQMRDKLKKGEGLEDFILEPTYEQKEVAPNEVKRRTKDGRVAIFDEETKKFIRFEK